MITAAKAAKFASRSQSKTRGAIDTASAVRNAEADLTRDIRRAADMGRYNVKFEIRSLPVAEKLWEKTRDLGYLSVLIPGQVTHTLSVSWPLREELG